MAREREESAQQEYAAAQSPDRLQAFADSHSGNPLAGLAELRLGDAAYGANRLDAAIIAYGRAADALKTGPLASRARLGLAMAKVQVGQLTDGEARLHQLADNVSEYRPIRAEATYDLASLAASAGNGPTSAAAFRAS